MAGIEINRAKYRVKHAERDWLHVFIDEQIKEESTVTKTLKIGDVEKEITSKKTTITPWKLFKLAENNGLKFTKIQASVEAEQVGAIGRARMILSGALKRKASEHGTLKGVDGAEHEVPAEYRDTLPKVAVKVVTPAAPAAPAVETV